MGSTELLDWQPAVDAREAMGRLKGGNGGELDTSAVLVGVSVGAVSLLLTSLAMGGSASYGATITLVVSAVLTVSVPAGVVTGFLSSCAETDVRHGGIASAVGTLVGLVLVGVAEAAMTSPDVLVLIATGGLIAYLFVVLFIFLVGGYVSQYTANLRWDLTNDPDQEWGTKGRFEDEDTHEWGTKGRIQDDDTQEWGTTGQFEDDDTQEWGTKGRVQDDKE